MLSLARVLVHPPRLLICDELSLGLAPIVVDEVYRTLASIRDAGTTLLIVEQHVRHALEIADDVVVLTKGEVVLRGAAADLRDELGGAPAAGGPRRGGLTSASCRGRRALLRRGRRGANRTRQGAPVHGGERDRRHPDEDGGAADRVGVDRQATTARWNTCAW